MTLMSSLVAKASRLFLGLLTIAFLLGVPANIAKSDERGGRDGHEEKGR